MTITAHKADVYAEVDIITAYIGGKNGKYETIPTIDADQEMLDILWRDAKAWAIAAIGASITDCQNTEGKLQLSLEGTGEKAILIIEPLLRAALARRIIGQWLQICGVANSEQISVQAQSSLLSILKHAGSIYPARRAIPPI